MFLSYKYRLYPNEKQEVLLRSTLASLCDLYNELRNKKVSKYKENKINLSKTDLRRLALEIRRSNNNPELKKIYSQVVQNVPDRVSYAFNNFEKRARVKKYKNYRSFTYPQSGFGVIQTNTPIAGHRLYLSGIGKVRTFFHRSMSGIVNRLTITRKAGEWYAIFLIDKPDPSVKSMDNIPEERIRGGDVGLEKFIILDDDSMSSEYPRFLRGSEENIIKLQRHLSRKKRGSNGWNRINSLSS